MSDYFNYDVVYAMNITDIDDKVKRSKYCMTVYPFTSIERKFLKDHQASPDSTSYGILRQRSSK